MRYYTYHYNTLPRHTCELFKHTAHAAVHHCAYIIIYIYIHVHVRRVFKYCPHTPNRFVYIYAFVICTPFALYVPSWYAYYIGGYTHATGLLRPRSIRHRVLPIHGDRACGKIGSRVKGQNVLLLLLLLLVQYART